MEFGFDPHTTCYNSPETTLKGKYINASYVAIRVSPEDLHLSEEGQLGRFHQNLK